MPEHADTHIGSRLRDVRKRRGLTQRDIATASGVSLSLVRKLEQGEVQDTRMETARKLAAALRVPTTCLLQRDAEPADTPTTDRWAPVRAALFAPPTQAPEEEPTADGIADALTATDPLLAADRFTDIAVLLPGLLRDADALTDPEGRAARVRLLQLTGWLLTQTRQYEAAAVALDRASDDASDRLQDAATVNTRCWLLLRQGRLDEARTLATRWADDLEPRMSRATPAELAAWGGMLLRVSAASVRDNRPGEAEDSLRLARSAAVALGREHRGADPVRTFGPATVALKTAEAAAVTDRPDRVLSLAARIPTGGLRPTSSNRNRHLLDVASAHTTMRHYGEAVEVLSDVCRVAPEWLPQQRYARDILGRIIARRRTLTPQMRTLADAVGVPV